MGILSTLVNRIRNVTSGRIVGRVSSGAGRAEELTSAQVRTSIDYGRFTTAVTIGAFGAVNSVDPMLTISRQIDSGSGNAHAFSDSSDFRRNGLAYNSFDARITLGQAGETYDHYAAFQSLPVVNAGTLTSYYGCYSGIEVATGATVTTIFHHSCDDFTGAGSCSTQYGVHIADLTSASVNWAVYAAGSTPSYFGGPLFFGPTGAISGTATSCEIGHNIYYDPARNDWFPRVANGRFALIEPHDPGTNSLAIFTGVTPASLATAVSDYHVSMRCDDDCFAIGPSGPFLFGSAENRIQLGGITSSFPMLLINGAAIDFKLADNSAFTAIRCAQFTCVPPSSVSLGTNGHFSIEMTSNTAGNLVYRGSDGTTRRSVLTFS